MQQLDSPSGAPPASPSRSPLQGIADAAARHYKEQFGRGPVRCKAHFAGRDAVLVILEGTMTPAETRLVEDGHAETVRSFRTLEQHAVQAALVAAVGALAGRPVRQGITGIDVQGDVVTELFVLESEDDALTPAG
ncbi:Na-translocating system protein MpsC family protein [Patulibacter americanus]|uniref:Na-translocating system protein MpsC family protein n=1 Tax=Patulibacter americanus TaxID=588672 RepID=UPI0003B32CD8|nr:Na-translocating system protein MpsC family protein [Patulibacter americanus]